MVAAHPSASNVTIGSAVGYLHDAAYAAYTAVPAAKLHVLPSGISTQTAAASLLQGLTSLSFIREAAQVKPGQWTLVHAAAGGVGTNLCQMLRALGARVIGTAGGEEKMKLARENGAEFVVDSRGGDLVAEVMKITEGHGVDAIFDGVGKATFDKDLEVVARKGTVVAFGNAVSRMHPVPRRYEGQIC